MTVERVRGGDVLRLERRPVSVEPDREYVSIGIRSFGKGLFHYGPRSGGQLGKLRFFEVVPDHLVLSNIKGWEGAVAVSTEVDAGCIASNRFLMYAPTSGRIDVGWARWYFLSDAGTESLQQASPGSADRNRTLAIDRFEALEIPLPSIDEQRRVAEHLDRIEAAAGELRHLSEDAATLSDALGVSIASRPDLSDAAKKVAKWRRVRLDQVLTQRTDHVSVEGHHVYDIAGVYSFGRGMFGRSPVEGSATSYRTLHRLHEGQLVMSRPKAWEGAIALVPAALDGWFVSPEFPTFDIDSEQVDPDYFRSVITSEQFWTRLSGASRGIGARRERVHALRLLEQEIDLPPLSAQHSVARVLAVLGDVEVRRSSANQRIDALLPAALNEAFSSLS